VGTVTLKDAQTKTQSQHFIDIYKKMQAQGPLSEEKTFETSMELLQEKLAELKVEREANWNKDPELVANFKDASDRSKTPPVNVNVRDIFKD
jgi:Mitochondrial ribosomal protein S23